MLMLRLELLLGPGHSPLPAHLGGVLHGFVEGGVKNHAPHLLPVLRPNSPHEAAHFMIVTPPLDQAIGECLDFSLVLYGDAARAWPILLRALLEQQQQQFHGHPCLIRQAWCAHPASPPRPLLQHGQLLEIPDGQPLPTNPQTLLQPRPAPSALHHLEFRSPLLLASRKAQRLRIDEGLPWPSLGAVLDSIADRLRALEPELAAALALPADWKAPARLREIQPLTPAARPARQVQWDYTASPRRPPGETPAPRRSFPIHGIVGDLIYPASGDPFEADLLYWGQWLGVGQKTTMGYGNYQLKDR